MTTDEANEVYDILVEVCQAPDGVMRDAFLHEMTSPNHTREWRFCGNLGFGGKLWHRGGRAFYVDCYSEHRTPEAKRIIDAANARLAEFERNRAEVEGAK